MGASITILDRKLKHAKAILLSYIQNEVNARNRCNRRTFSAKSIAKQNRARRRLLSLAQTISRQQGVVNQLQQQVDRLYEGVETQ